MVIIIIRTVPLEKLDGLTFPSAKLSFKLILFETAEGSISKIEKQIQPSYNKITWGLYNMGWEDVLKIIIAKNSMV